MKADYRYISPTTSFISSGLSHGRGDGRGQGTEEPDHPPETWSITREALIQFLGGDAGRGQRLLLVPGTAQLPKSWDADGEAFGLAAGRAAPLHHPGLG